MVHRTSGEIGFITGQWPLDPHRPTLVFIHGAGTSRLIWEQQVESLNTCANTMAVDLPGHGTSKGPGRDTVSDYALAVLDLIETLRVPRPVLCGLSMGGAIVQTLLIEHPDRFPAGILVNTGARLKVLPMIFETIAKSYEEYAELTCTFAVSPKNISEDLKKRVKACLQSTAEITANDFRACDAFDVMTRLGSLLSPTLVLVARDDLLTPPKFGAFLAENIRGARKVTIEDAGHLSPLEKPADVSNAIRDFLDLLAI